MATAGVQPHARLGRYELLARLATGGMGEIFLARLQGAEGFEKLYVVKRILPHLADDARFRQMLIAEARIAAKMSHANICQVYELGETDGQLYIVMEYLDGVTMLPLLRKSSKENLHLDYGFVAAVAQQTCDALHYAHELKERGEYIGLVHRDVTPSNMFLTESGVVKVLDFGIAKAKGASTNTQEGTVKGKYAYMAPEQLRGTNVDRRVDVFALGVVLYEMLALRRLFQRKTDYLTFRAVMEQPIPDIRRYRDDVPEALSTVLARALDRDPANRPATARQLAAAVLDAIAPLKRPWTQGEIGDFVHANFAEEIGRRSQQVASAIHRTASGVHSARSTMPLISQQDDQTSEDTDEDSEFPSVETDSEGAPAKPTDNFASVTPPPFAGETGASGSALPPLRITPANSMTVPTSGTASVVVVRDRSMLFPIIAIAAVAVAGVALYLVWKQTQERQPPAEIKIVQEPSTTPAPPPSVDPGAPPGSATDPPVTNPSPGAGTKPQQTVETCARLPSDASARANALVARHKPEIDQCLNAHRDEGLPGETTVRVFVAPSGKVKRVSLEPSSVNATPVGACIRGVLLPEKCFSRQEFDFRFTLTVSKKSP